MWAASGVGRIDEECDQRDFMEPINKFTTPYPYYKRGNIKY